jgi:hypothetical protein
MEGMDSYQLPRVIGLTRAGGPGGRAPRPLSQRRPRAVWLTLPFVIALASATQAQEQEQDARHQCLASHEQSQVLRLESKLIEASQALRACSKSECPAPIRADCIKWLDEVRYAIPTVVFMAQSDEGDETNVTVYANDNKLVGVLDGRPVELDPGVYDFRFEWEDADPKVLKIVLREGEKNRAISVDFRSKQPAAAPGAGPTRLPPPPPPEPEEYRPVPFWTYLFGGLALAGAGSAVYFGLKARSDHDDAMNECAPLCESEQVDEIKLNALIADASMAGAVLSAGLATFFYLNEPLRKEEPEKKKPKGSKGTEVGLAPTRTGFVLNLQGRF